MFPGVILLVLIYKIVVDLGLLDTKVSLVLAYTTFALPFCVWMLKATSTRSRSRSRRPAGSTASPFGTFWRIVMPLSLPGIAVTAFFMFITAWNEVLFANVFLTETENYTLPIGLRIVFQFEQQYGWLTAGAVIMTIPRHHRVPVRPALPRERPDTRRVKGDHPMKRLLPAAVLALLFILSPSRAGVTRARPDSGHDCRLAPVRAGLPGRLAARVRRRAAHL